MARTPCGRHQDSRDKDDACHHLLHESVDASDVESSVQYRDQHHAQNNPKQPPNSTTNGNSANNCRSDGQKIVPLPECSLTD
jgi:hypothetical protein